MAWKKPKLKPLRTSPRKGSEFVTVFSKRRAGPMDTRKRRVNDVAKGRSRKPKNEKEKAEDNPASWMKGTTSISALPGAGSKFELTLRHQSGGLYMWEGTRESLLNFFKDSDVEEYVRAALSRPDGRNVYGHINPAQRNPSEYWKKQLPLALQKHLDATLHTLGQVDAPEDDFDLSEVDLSGSYLVGVRLAGVDLSRANLSGAMLTGADLTLCNLTKANLTKANLTGAGMGRAKLLGAKLLGAKLVETNLQNADLRDANLQNANLSMSYLTSANLTGAELRGAKLYGAHLKHTRMPDGELFTGSGEEWLAKQIKQDVRYH